MPRGRPAELGWREVSGCGRWAVHHRRLGVVRRRLGLSHWQRAVDRQPRAVLKT